MITSAWPERFPRRYGVCGLLALLALASGCHQSNSPAPAKPAPSDTNLVLITLDTTRADHLSCYAVDTNNRHYAKTPRLDELARQGLRFEHATAQVPLTLPSHACILTGTYPEVHGLRDMGGFALNPRLPTLATMAHDAGLVTAAFVGSKAVGRQYGLARGFDLYDDEMPSRAMPGKLPGLLPERRAGVTTDRALDWLREHGQKRFFLWVHYYDPHAPYDPPEPYRNGYAKDLYSGEIAYTDEQAGRILSFLDEQGLRRKTLIIVIGDHGEGLYDHGEGEHGVFLYDDTLNVPLIMAGPKIPAGQTIAAQVRSIDILPTVAGLLGTPADRAVQGVSLWPLIERGRPLPGKGSNYAYLETIYPKTHMNWSELRGLRTDKWKFILAPHPELYDLERDPAEKDNVILRHPAEADQLQKKIWEVIGPPAENQKLAYQPLDEATREELESLGYASAGTPREVILNGSGPDPKGRMETLLALRDYGRLVEAGQYTRAARVMEGAVRNDPDNPLLRIYLGRAYEELGNWRSTISTYQGAVDAGMATNEVLARLGEAYLHAHEVSAAIPAMEKARQFDPTDLDNLYNLGTAYLGTERLRDAERCFQAILVQDDHYSAAYNSLGLVSASRGETEAARKDFEKAVAVSPDDPEPLLNLGVLYQKAGNKELALRYLKQFLEKASPGQYGDVIRQVRATVKELRRGA